MWMILLCKAIRAKTDPYILNTYKKIIHHSFIKKLKAYESTIGSTPVLFSKAGDINWMTLVSTCLPAQSLWHR